MRTVRCVSPHGGAHHGLRADNEQDAPPGYRGELLLPPNEGGWVWAPVLRRHVAVGSEVDAPEAPDFIADGFHFVDAGTGQGDACQVPGDACWCGQHRDAPLPDPGPPPEPAPAPKGAPGKVADLIGKEHS